MVNWYRFRITFKTLLNPWFVVCCISWATVYFSRLIGHPIFFFQGHFTDLLAVPVIANLGLWFQRFFIVKKSTYVLKVGHVVFIVAYLSLVYELLLPFYNAKKYIGDLVDVFLYIIGGVFFFLVMNKPLNKDQ